MKSILLTLILITTSFYGISQDSTGIKFETGTWAEILAIAAKERKPIVVDAYTTWCGPCKWMAKNTFTDQSVGNYVNANFVPYKMDMEKGEGIEFAKKNDVRAYPTILFFNSKGDLIHRGVGAKNPEDFLELCRDALDPKEQFTTYQKKFAKGQNDSPFLLKYLDKCQSAGVSIEEPFNTYWETLGEKEKITEDNLILMSSVTRRFSDLDHELFLYLKKNKTLFIEAIGNEKFDPFWSGAYKGAVWQAASAKKGKEQKEKINKAKSNFPDYKHEIDELFDYYVAYKSKDEGKIASSKTAYSIVTTDWQFLNSEAWSLYEKGESDADYKKALGWADRSVTLNANYFNLDTQGAILFKLKRYDEAKVALREAVAKITDEVRDDSLNETEKLLRKIESGDYLDDEE